MPGAGVTPGIGGVEREGGERRQLYTDHEVAQLISAGRIFQVKLESFFAREERG